MNPPADEENPHAGQGMVVLDIGGDIGALMVSTPAALAGVEIEICPAGRRADAPDEGGDWWPGGWRSRHGPAGARGHEHGHEHGAAWPHVAVLPRPVPDGTVCAAVFPALRAGRYELWRRPDGQVVLTAVIVGGHVTSAEWPPETGD